MAKPRVIVVLGMHHSGTSVIARSLLIFNVCLGDDLMPCQPDHPTGFWEDNQVTAINDQILTTHGFSWRKPGFDCARLKECPSYRPTIKGIAENIRVRFGPYPLWGFKDPRTCRLVPLWKDVFKLLRVQASFIIVVRHPRSVAESLRGKYGMPLRLGYSLWWEHMAAAVRETQNGNRLFISYDRMLDNPKRELRREASALKLDLSRLYSISGRIFMKSFLDRQLRHQRYKPGDMPSSDNGKMMCERAFVLLDAAAADSLSGQAFRKAWSMLLKGG